MQRSCVICAKPFEASRPSAAYCGATCRKRASRAAKPGGDKPSRQAAGRPRPASTPVSGEDDVAAAVLAELQAADRDGSALGRQAIALARRMAEFDTGSSMAALSRELRAVMAEALGDQAQATLDPLDELKARRDRKRTAG